MGAGVVLRDDNPTVSLALEASRPTTVAVMLHIQLWSFCPLGLERRHASVHCPVYALLYLEPHLLAYVQHFEILRCHYALLHPLPN